MEIFEPPAPLVADKPVIVNVPLVAVPEFGGGGVGIYVLIQEETKIARIVRDARVFFMRLGFKK